MSDCIDDSETQPTVRRLLSCSDCDARKLALYQDLKDGEVKEIERLRRGTRHVPARRIILRANETPAEIYTLREGWAFRFMLLPDGRRQILTYYLPGSSIPYEVLRAPRLHFSVQTLTDVTLCVFRVEDIKRFVEDRPEAYRRLCFFYERRAIMFDHFVTDLGKRTAQEKIARLILNLHERLARRGLARDFSFTFPLRQEHIADTLGLTPVHVSRTMGVLRHEGLIDIQGQTLTITNELEMLRRAGMRSPVHG